MNFCPAQTICQQGFKRGAIADIQPFCSCNETAEVAFPAQFGNLREKVQMEASKLARLDSMFSTKIGIPLLPILAYPMVPHVRRVADEQGRAPNRHRSNRAKIRLDHLGTVE